MKKAAVVIDSWKLSIFKKHLDEGGFEYSQHPGITPETITLNVLTETVSRLQPFVQAATNEAARSRMN